MVTIRNPFNLEQVYRYQLELQVPYFYQVSFENWKESFENDMDGEGRPLFRKLYTKVAYDENTLIGFIQYGYTALGFDNQGDISIEMSYPVIRSLYFNEGRKDAGTLLLQAALQELGDAQTIYAFFHYFGMSCFARHGKLYERLPWIQELLYQFGFEIEHENVYYSIELGCEKESKVQLIAHDLTMGSQQSFDFILKNRQIGGCEVHYPNDITAYLRWIYVNDTLQNQGLGTQCMEALTQWLWNRGFVRLDTDTALTNLGAQHYYEKNGFTRMGITRSFLLNK